MPSENTPDGILNYDIHEEIGRGACSVVYLATCKRGRMKDRLVAVKKVRGRSPLRTDPENNLLCSLSHPSLASVFSVFISCGARYQVMDLCLHGSLQQILSTRQPPLLSEDELRGVLRGLADALVYLQKESIVHRDINPASVLIDGQLRVKLSRFNLAKRLSSESEALVDPCGVMNYRSPEMVARRPYSLPTDVWSLGCLALTCASGCIAFDATATDDVCENILTASYDPQPSSSYELKDLLSCILRINPWYRLSASQVLSHPFLNSATPGEPLQLGSTSRPYPSMTSETLGPHTDSSGSSRSLGSKRSNGTMSSISTATRRLPMADRTNLLAKSSVAGSETSSVFSCLRSVQCSSSTSSSQATPLLARKAALHVDPECARLLGGRPNRDPRPTFSLRRRLAIPAADSDAGSTTPGLSRCESESSCRSEDLSSSTGVILETIAPRPPPRSTYMSRPATESTYSCQHQRPVNDDKLFAAPPVAVLSCDRSETGGHHISAPTRLRDAARPAPLNTTYLAPQTQKLLKGQLVVLPSRSLLVDFREGERRKRRKGDEVLVVTGDGLQVQVYSVPHLSVPCCLMEPSATYTLDDLPRAYWHIYNDAALVVNDMKTRVAKLVWKIPEAQCMLMANCPMGDIHIILHSTSHSAEQIQTSGGAQATPREEPTVRVRLLRRRRVMEISSRVPLSGQPSPALSDEWIKKTLPISEDAHLADVRGSAALSILDPSEQAAISVLERFLHVCQAADTAQTDVPSSTYRRSGTSDTFPPRHTNASINEHSQRTGATPTQAEPVDPLLSAKDSVAHETPASRGPVSSMPRRPIRPKSCASHSSTPASPATSIQKSMVVAPRPLKFPNVVLASCAKAHSSTRDGSANATAGSHTAAFSRSIYCLNSDGAVANTDPDSTEELRPAANVDGNVWSDAKICTSSTKNMRAMQIASCEKRGQRAMSRASMIRTSL